MFPTRAPSVTPKTIRSTIGGRRERVEVNLGPVETWTEELLREALVSITIDQVRTQKALENEPVGVFVDGKTGRDPLNVERMIDVNFGTGGLEALKSLIEQTVRQQITRTTKIKRGSLIDDWRWRFSPDKTRAAPERAPNHLVRDDCWYYEPFGPNRAYVA